MAAGAGLTGGSEAILSIVPHFRGVSIDNRFFLVSVCLKSCYLKTFPIYNYLDLLK